jgi:hypothetical protein
MGLPTSHPLHRTLLQLHTGRYADAAWPCCVVRHWLKTNKLLHTHLHARLLLLLLLSARVPRCRHSPSPCVRSWHASQQGASLRWSPLVTRWAGRQAGRRQAGRQGQGQYGSRGMQGLAGACRGVHASATCPPKLHPAPGQACGWHGGFKPDEHRQLTQLPVQLVPQV